MTKIKDIVKRIYSGGTPDTRKSEYWNGNIKWLSSGETRSNFIYDTNKRITDLGVTNSSTKLANKNSIVIACAGQGFTRGQTSYLMDDMYINQSIVCIDPDKDKVDSLYLYYFFKNSYQLLRNLSDDHSSRGSITTAMIKDLEVDFPDIEIQKKVSGILYSLDKKIELNNEINNNLYDMGDNLYNEYFDKYKGNLPSGYKIVKLNEVADIYDSKRKPMSSREREQHRGIYPYYGATSIIDYVDNYIFDGTYLLMGEDGTVKTDEGFPVLQYIWGKNWINNHAHVLKGKTISTELLMFALRKINIENVITGAVQPKINQENMNKIEFVIGNDSKNKELEEILTNLMNKSKNIIEENKKLEQLRDTLLPKLMNGEIDLDNIEI